MSNQSNEIFHNMREQMKPSDDVINKLKNKIQCNKKSNLMPKTWIISTAAASLIIIAAAAVLPGLLNTHSKLITENESSQNAFNQIATKSSTKTTKPENSENEVWIEPKWNDKTITQKFPVFNINGVEYSCMSSEIQPGKVGRKLGSSDAKGFDIYENKSYTLRCEYYVLKSISTDCAVGVKFEGFDGYYPFTNHLYKPETLGDFIKDLDLRNNLIFNKIYYSYWKDGVFKNGNSVSVEYTLPDTSVIWDLLLSNPALKNEGDAHYGQDAMSVGIDVKVIGEKNISLAVNQDGYLQTNILATGKSFFIGKEKVQAFMEYVKKNGAAKETQDDTIIREDDNQSGNQSNGGDSSQTVETKISSTHTPPSMILE